MPRRVVASCLLALAAVGCDDAPPVAAPPATPTGTTMTPAAPTPDYGQSFDTATSASAPIDSLPPPAITRSGKPTAGLAKAVRDAWDGVTFPLTDGKPADVRVTLDTAAGDIEVTLFPELAPNHVRNFLALARVGYFDGLAFDRVVRQDGELADGTPVRIEFITAGCPTGEGTPGLGHLGYFLKPEFNTLAFEEGTVGFWREEDPASAGTRFFITLGPTPVFDGKYTAVGKVSRGMNAVHAVAQGKPHPDEPERPETPVAIRGVTRSAE